MRSYAERWWYGVRPGLKMRRQMTNHVTLNKQHLEGNCVVQPLRCAICITVDCLFSNEKQLKVTQNLTWHLGTGVLFFFLQLFTGNY